MKPNKYFDSIIKNRGNDRDSDISNELAKREVDTIFFLLKNFYDLSYDDKDYKVVEIGCGDGYLKKHFEEKNFNYIGYDIEDLNIEKDKIDLADNSVDMVINIGLIEALESAENLISESKRILKKGGIFYTLTPNWKKDYKNFYDNPIHKLPFTPNSMKQILTLMYNFNDVEIFPGLRCKPKWYYKGKFRFEKAYYLLPFNQYTHKKEQSLYVGSFFRGIIPEFLKGHSRSLTAIAKK
jgi:SAM-dependent methyltransferase